MRIAIIGGGFTGLTAAYELTKHGHHVTLFERDTHLGGLAYGFKEKNWNWHLEAAYHHLFTNDHAILGLISELGLADKIIIKRPITANLYKGKTYQFDSPAHLLGFPHLSLIDKLRTGVIVAFCKLYPFWQTLEGFTAQQFFTKIGGMRAWNIIWEPLMAGKFGALEKTIAASWLWARIHKRTPKLAYIEGGFQTLVTTLEKTIKKQGGIIKTGITVPSIQTSPKITIGHQTFDRVLLTTPTPIAYKLIPEIANPAALTIPHLHAQVIILETTTPILQDTYWLSVTDRSYPFLAVVAHTNFMNPAYYGGKHLTYIGNYLPPAHPFLAMDKETLLKHFMPSIQKISPTFKKSMISKSFLFVGPFAQPVHQLHYSQKAPTLHTALPHVYLANMDSIFPWDRGTNYAVELGRRVASVILSSER
jgi:protoporphyrinogen oxidase